MTISLLFMSLLFSLNGVSNTPPVPQCCDQMDCEHSESISDWRSIDSSLIVDDIEQFSTYVSPEDALLPASASAPAVNYRPNTTFNTTNYFTNLKDYSPRNNIGSCGYVSLIQLMSFYDTFYNDSVIPENYEYKNVNAKNENDAKTQSPGVINEYWSSSSYGSYYDYCNGTANYNMQSKLTVLNNIISNKNNSTNFTYSIGAWSYQNVLNSLYGNTNTVNVITTSNKTQSEYLQTIRTSIDAGHPVVVHVNNVGDSGGGHSVVAYDYDQSGIYAHYGWGATSSTYRLFSSYNQIWYVAELDYSALKHSHSNNYVINDKGHCGCNLSDEVKILSGGTKNSPPTLYWMQDLYNPTTATLLIRCKNRFNFSNPWMSIGYVYISSTTNSATLTNEQWSAIWDLGGHNFTISLVRQSPLEEYNSTATVLDFLGILKILDLNESDYGFTQHYVPKATYKSVSKNGHTFATTRLRTGHINDTGISETGKWYTVLSAKKAEAGTAYLSYDFNFDFNMIDIDISFWAAGEGLNKTNGTATIEYKDACGYWVTTPVIDLLNDTVLSTNRLHPTTYTLNFPNGTRSFRIFSTVNAPSGEANKARICVGDIELFNR